MSIEIKDEVVLESGTRMYVHYEKFENGVRYYHKDNGAIIEYKGDNPQGFRLGSSGSVRESALVFNSELEERGC